MSIHLIEVLPQLLRWQKPIESNQISSLISLQGKRGATIDFLHKATGIDRWAVGEICKDLEKDNKIKNKRKGRLNIYYPNQTAYDYNSYIESVLFKKKILSNYFADNISFDTTDISETIDSWKKFNKKDLSKIKWHLSRKQRESISKIININDEIKDDRSISSNQLQRKLQSFILNVGVFVTFVFLISSSSELKKVVSKDLESDNEDVINVEILNWLNRVISPKISIRISV